MSNNLLNNTTSLQNILEALQNKAVNPDTTDATATANDILSGKTAYVSGQKITGTIAFAPAKTITPNTTSQTAISSGYYAQGNITVAGDANLVAGNIKKGTSIFGVVGNYEGAETGDDTDDSLIDTLITGEISTCFNNKITKIRNYAFFNCSKLTSVNFPTCSFIGNYAFQNCYSLTTANVPACLSTGPYAFFNCSNLTSIHFPVCSYIGNYTFYGCLNLTSINFPLCSYIGDYAFWTCRSLALVSFPVCSSIKPNAFYACSSLTSADFGGNSAISKCTIYQSAFTSCQSLTNLTLRYSFVATLSNINAFANTPMSVSTLTGSFGSIYVPASLVNAYKSATNWATYADRITAIVEEPTLISFTIEGISYQAEEGMTWEEWVNSEYNTGSFSKHLSTIINKNNKHICTQNLQEVYYGDNILANYDYVSFSVGSEN